MNKLIRKIYKKNYKIDIKSLESGPLTCNTVITVTGPLGIASYIFHNQPIGLEKGTFFGYSMDFVKDRIEKLILGVTEGWTFELHLNGIGFKSFKIDDWYCLDVGFSNLIKYKPKPKVIIKNMKNKIILYSVDEDYLKHVSYALRQFAYPDVYKGKGITLKNEILKLKKKSKS